MSAERITDQADADFADAMHALGVRPPRLLFAAECPAGGEHHYVERETWDHRTAVGCDECGATPPREG